MSLDNRKAEKDPYFPETKFYDFYKHKNSDQKIPKIINEEYEETKKAFFAVISFLVVFGLLYIVIQFNFQSDKINAIENTIPVNSEKITAGNQKKQSEASTAISSVRVYSVANSNLTIQKMIENEITSYKSNGSKVSSGYWEGIQSGKAGEARRVYNVTYKYFIDGSPVPLTWRIDLDSKIIIPINNEAKNLMKNR